MKFCAYEGGPDTFGPNTVVAKKAASLDPRMSSLVIRYLDIWYAKGGDQFNWFVLGASNFDTPYGTWALTDNLRELRQPKELGYDAVRAAPRATLSTGSAPPSEIDARDFSGANEPLSSHAKEIRYFVPTCPAKRLEVSVSLAVQPAVLCLPPQGLDQV